MKKAVGFCLVLVLVLAPVACGLTTSTGGNDAGGGDIEIFPDVYFEAYAWFDSDGNGQVDPGDPPLEGARLEVVDANGVKVDAITGEDGFASAAYMGSYTVIFPVTVRMLPPEGSEYTRVGEREVVFEDKDLVTETHFLFK